jgi:hypothetical protein
LSFPGATKAERLGQAFVITAIFARIRVVIHAGMLGKDGGAAIAGM